MSGQRILLLNPPWKAPILRDYYCTSVSKAGYLWPPIDLLAQAGRLRDAGHDVRLVDAVASRLDPAACLAIARDFDPHVVLILTSPLSAEDDDLLVSTLERRRIVATGEAVFGDPRRYLEEHPTVEAALVDFTADGVVRLLAGETRRLPGVWRRSDDGILPMASNDGEPFRMPPAAHDLLPVGTYRMPLLGGIPFASVLTDFGCPYRCRFCNSGSRGHRIRDIQDLAAELDRIVALGFHHVFIKDMSFGAVRGHAERVCSLLRERGLTWNAYARADDLDGDLVRTMAQAGCRLLQIGLESGDSSLRRTYGKPTPDDAFDRAVSACRARGIRVGLHLVLGLPGESWRSLWRTRRFLARLRPDFVSINIATYRAGSAFEREARSGRSRLAGDERVLLAARALLYLDYYLDGGWIRDALHHVRTRGDLEDLATSGLALLRSLILSGPLEFRWMKRLRSGTFAGSGRGRASPRHPGKSATASERTRLPHS